MAKKGEIVIRGGKRIISDGKGGGRVVTAKDTARASARVRIKRDTASGKAPPIPGIVTKGTPRTQKELNAARAKAAARKKKRVKPPASATENEPTKRGLKKAFDEAAEGRRKAEAAQQRKK